MLDFDQSVTWQVLEKRIAETDSARQRAIMQTVLAHMKAEADADLDGLMNTLVADPQYHTWTAAGDTGPKGYDAVRKFYADFIAGGGAILVSPIDRLVVDDDSLVNEATMTTLGSWRVARSRGYAIPEDRGHYALRMRIVNLWTFDENTLAYGEDAFVAIDPSDFDHLADDELPKVYIDYLRSIGHEV